MTALLASSTRKKMTALTLTETLSLVMTSCGGTSMVMVRRLTLTILSTSGMRRSSPGPVPSPPGLTTARACLPKRKMTARSYSRRIRTAFRMMKNAMMATGMSPSVQSNPSMSRLLRLGAVRGPADPERQPVYARHAHRLAGRDGRVLGDGAPDLAVELHLPFRIKRGSYHGALADHPRGPGGRGTPHRAHPGGDGPDREPRARPHRGQDHRPRHAETRLGCFVEHEGAKDHGDDAADGQHPVTRDLDLGDEQGHPEQDEQEPGPVDGQALEGKEGQDQGDASDHAGKHDARVRQLEEDAEHADHHEDIGDIRIRDQSQETVPEPDLDDFHRRVLRLEGDQSPLRLDDAPVDLLEQVRHAVGDQVDDLQLERLALRDGSGRPPGFLHPFSI